MRFGITGHRDLTPHTVEVVTAELRRHLVGEDHVGITNLAEGADQMFAQIVVDQGGRLDVIVPSLEYRRRREDLAAYDVLVGAAARVTQLPYTEDGPEAHMAASLVMVERCDTLLAVWDGQPARGFGGTADVVEYANQVQVPVLRVWPAGSSRKG